MVKAGHLILSLVLLTLPIVPTAQAQTPSPPYLQIILDKPYYYPGDAGRLMIDLRNTLSINMQVYNFSVSFPWTAYINGHWDGNQSIQVNQPVRSGGWLPTVTVSFAMPSDSRYFYSPYICYPTGCGGGRVSVWASGVGSGGGTGTFSQTFNVVNAYYAGTYLDWHYIFFILIVMTAFVGIMTGAVLFYVYTGRRHRQVLRWGTQ